MKNIKKWRPIFLILFDLLLIAALFTVFVKERDREKRSQRTLNRAVSIVAEESRREIAEKSNQEVEETLISAGSWSSADSVEEMVTQEPKALSIRGDSFSVPGGDPQAAYPAILEQILADSGISMRVLDYTLDEKSVLTHLYYAGISPSEIQEYINRNVESDTVQKSSSYESEVGDVSGLNLKRSDYDAIPVIFIGYYGGWGGNVFELIEMQKRILATYNQQDFFVIVGNHPLNVTDVEKFDSIMLEYWGKEHYLNVAGVNGNALNTQRGHVNLAKRIFAKLKNQGYLPK